MNDSGHSSREFFSLTQGQFQHYRMLARFPELRPSIWTSYRISGSFDAAALAAAVAAVVRRHDALRIGVRSAPGELPEQWIRDVPPGRLLISWRRVRSDSRQQFERYVRHVMASGRSERWDLAEQYPFKFILLKYSEELHAFLAGFSHMAMDATARDIVLRDLWCLYRAHGNVAGGEFPSESKRFADAARSLAGMNERYSRRLRQGRPERAIPTAPPITQFRAEHAPRTVGSNHVFDFALDGSPLTELRSAIHGTEFTEFQWIFAVLARTVFLFSPQDRIKFSVAIDMRGPAERDLAGMFVVMVPAIVDRPDTLAGARFLSHVKQELFSAMLAYRQADSGTLDQILRDSSEQWGARAEVGLSISYRNLTPDQPGRPVEPANVERDVYFPTLNYSVRGISTEVVSLPDTLQFRLAFSGRMFSTDGAHDFISRFRQALADMASSEADDTAVLSAPAHPIPAHVTALTDAQGKVMIWANPARIVKQLEKHPDVMSATVHPVSGATGGTLLGASVVVSGNITEAALREHLLKAAATHHLVFAPHRISVSRSAGAL
jgi:hypothetical protein